MSLPFSPIRIAGDFAFLSGQVGIKDGKLRSEYIEEQTAQPIENVIAILRRVRPVFQGAVPDARGRDR